MATLDQVLSQSLACAASLPGRSFTAPRWYFELPVWVREPSAPGNAAHNYSLPMRIRGALNRGALERAVTALVERHDVLRSAFSITNGRLAQHIMPLRPVVVPMNDLELLPPDAREAAATQMLVEDACQPFDLTCAPLLRAALFRLEPDHHILLLTTHHAVCDDWSTGILVHELFALYSGLARDERSPLAEITYRYSDFANSLEQHLQGEEAEERLQYWKSRLDEHNDYHHVDPDHPRSSERSYRGAHETRAFSAEISRLLKVVSARERVSPYMVLLASMQCLLRAYSGAERIGIGTCVANRAITQIENLIGPFANVAIMRTDFSAQPTFRDVLRQVREDSLNAYSRQDFPFGAVVEALRPERRPGCNPLFQVLFVLLNAPNERCLVPGLEIEPVALDTGTCRYDLNFWVRNQDCIDVDLQYNSDLFEKTTARKMLDDYGSILSRMLSNPEGRVADVGIAACPSVSNVVPSTCSTISQVRGDTAIETQLIQLWEELLQRRPIGVDDDFFELGGDSLVGAQFFARVKTLFKQTIPLSALVEAPTVGKLAKLITASRTRGPAEHLVRIQTGNSRPPLFCVHGQSGNVLMYRMMAPYVGSDQPVYALQPRGVDGKKAPLTRIEDMAAAYLEEIHAAHHSGPYFLAGYCMGGTVAYEMAQQLRRCGETVGLLALLDTFDWSRLPHESSQWETLYVRAQMLRFTCLHFWTMGWHEKVAGLRARAEQWDSPPPSPVSVSNRDAALRYVPQPYPGHLLHVCTSKNYPKYMKREVGWTRLAASVERFSVKGYPWQLFEQALMDQWGAKLRNCIDAQASQGK